jgi:hypothetical protein
MGYIDDLMKAPADSLLVGTLATNDRDGKLSTSSIIDGTPEGFRVLAGVLLKMADSVEANSEGAGKGWGLVLHPDDISALRTLDVEALSLGCKPELSLEGLFSTEGEDEDEDGIVRSVSPVA